MVGRLIRCSSGDDEAASISQPRGRARHMNPVGGDCLGWTAADRDSDQIFPLPNGQRLSVRGPNRCLVEFGKVSGNYIPLPAGTHYRQMRPVEWMLVLEESLPVERILTRVFSQATIYQLR